VVVLTMLASNTFDTRLIWEDSHDRESSGNIEYPEP
jgi:uncharacterized paraquat-inducible protein A